MRLHGTVIEGDGRGRTLGYPTANIAVPDSFAAANGVYAARVWIDGEDSGHCCGAMANLGVKPTFSDGDGERILEFHLFGFEGDLYGREVTAELVEFIRPERKFDSPEELRRQITEDEKQIKEIFKQRHCEP